MTIINVAISQGNVLLERRSCRLYQLADGTLGVLCDGIVFPLNPGPSINLEGSWYYPKDCRLLLEAPPGIEELLFAGSTKWWVLEQGEYYRYLLLDLTDAHLQHAAASLAEAGFDISRHGVAFSPALDGRHFRSFIRLEPSSNTPEVERARIAIAFQSFSMSVPETAENESHNSPPDVVNIRSRWLEAERSLAKLEEELALKRRMMTATIASARAQQQSLETELALLRGAFEAQRERLVTMEQTLNTMRLKNPSALDSNTSLTIVQLQHDLDMALEEWGRASDAIKSEQREREAYATENSKLAAEIERLSASPQNSNAIPRSRSSRSRADLVVVITTLMPRLRLVRGSEDFLVHEASDWGQILGVLSQLQADPSSVPSKRVKATKGWLERHFNTGRGDIGRVYWRDQDRHLEVLISDKGSQQRDFDWMKR
jgi:hypothetical protein